MSTAQTNNIKFDSQEESFNIKEFALKLKKRWPYFLLSVIIFLAIAYIALHLSTPIFKLKATVLIKDDKGLSGGAFFEETELFGGKKNLENEIGILSSRSMIQQVINKLDFEVSYFERGRFTTKQVYNNSPFKVLLDTSHNQIFYVPIHIQVINENEFQLEIKGEEVLNGKLGVKSENRFIENINFQTKGRFGQMIENKDFGFTIFLVKPVLLGEDKDYYFMVSNPENIIDVYKEKISISPINKKASIVELSVAGSVIEKETAFLNVLLDVYIESGLEEKNKVALNTIRFIDDQLIGITDSLKAAEEDLQYFRSKNNVLDVTVSNRVLIEKLDVLNNESAVLNLKFKYYEYLRSYILKNLELNQIVAPSAMGIEDPLLNSQIQELVRLSTEKSGLQMSSTDKNPYLEVINERIRSVKHTLLENLNNIINTSQISLKHIKDRINQAQGQVDKLPVTERALVGIQRRFVLNDNIYNYLLQKRAEAGIAKAANTPDNIIIDRAQLVSKEPIFPRRSIFYLGALIFGIALPFIAFGIYDFWNNTISSVGEFEKLSAHPIIATIGHNGLKQKLINESPKSSFAESFRSARINLQYLAPHLSKKVIGITSSISGEGKTFFSVNLAISISLLNKRTLLIGADLRKPALSGYFKLDDSKGLTTFLIGKNTTEQIIHKTHIENLDLIFSGPIPPNPSELLNTPKLEELFNVLKNQYDYIIIDSAPVGLVSDYYAFLEYVDINLYVVRIDYTSKELVRKLNSLHQIEKFKNFSIVLNDTVNENNQYAYGYIEVPKDNKLITFGKKLLLRS